MNELFGGRRRKMGCITLVIACVFTGAWLRSRVVCDWVHIVAGQRIYRLDSQSGAICWRKLKFFTRDPDSIRLGSSELRTPGEDGTESRFAVPYSSLAVPLILLSAYLMLWNPKKTQTPITER
jgi:hypothetical protein